MSNRCWPVVVVTGANAGVGYGICERFLLQLCSRQPPDASPFITTTPFHAERDKDAPEMPCEGITLILACRRVERAEAAKAQLLLSLDAHIKKLQSLPDYDGYAAKFRENVRIDAYYLDLAMVSSVLKFAKTVSTKYPYISHLICNAGVASFSGIDWWICTKQVILNPIMAFTAPLFNKQHSGEISVDGLGWVWQCNVFGHFVLFRALQPMLSSRTFGADSRVIWMSSLESYPTFFSLEDWQLKSTDHSYETSKYQIDLLATTLDRLALKKTSESDKRVRHFIAQPGVVATNIAHALIHPSVNGIKVLLFYIARAFGSPHHTITAYKAAISAVYLSLVSLAYITFPSSEKHGNGTATNGHASKHTTTDFGKQPVRFNSETDSSGKERVGYSEVRGWEEHQADGPLLLDKCEKLYQTFLEEHLQPANFETASEKM